MQHRLFAVLVLLCSSMVRADIYEWRDANGHRHFTNSMANVPAEQQSDARVVVTALPASESLPVPVTQPVMVTQPAEAPRTEAQVVYDYSRQPDPYAQGLEDGIALARAVAAPNDGGIEINGPLAVANADPLISVTSPYPYFYPEYPLVTTSFDRGRSRHLTLRMLLQDQFQLDRDGPYVYQRGLPPPNGPNLRVVLPRGLPHDRARKVAPHQAARVITR